jgi:hypothetical protein
VLRPLGEAIGQWTPQSGTRWRADPLSLLAAGWSDIVGEDVARNTHPTRILDGTLWVTTRSSAWSQQLSFLADRVLAAVRSRLAQPAVERLRFRVGKLPMRALVQRPHRPPAPPSPAVPAERLHAENAAEALSRFRTSVDARRRANLRAGWKECGTCGAPITPRDALCVPCLNVRSQARSAAAMRLMFEAPWLGYAGTALLIEGLTPADYESIRSRLLSNWWEALARVRASKRLSRDGRERTIASSYVVLKSKLPPEVIDPATVRSVLGDELNDLIYGTEYTKKTDVE